MRRISAFSACRLALCLTGLVTLAACGSLSSTTERVASAITPYTPEMVQGNLITSDQVALLRPGMTRNQVRDILGSPLVASVFHANRWDYAFVFKRPGVESLSRKLTVHFKGDVLDRFEGDPMPSEAEFVSKLESGRKLGKIPPLQASEEDLKKFNEANPRRAEPTRPAVSTTPPSSYPPLEPATR
jgi:outer membrane protein assembly factor BamE